MKKYILMFWLIAVALLFSACDVGAPWAPGEGGAQDGEYRYSLYDQETEFVCDINGDKATLSIREKINLYNKIRINIFEGSYSLDNDNNIVISVQEAYIQEEYIGSSGEIETYKGYEREELKENYEEGYCTKEEYEENLALINGEKQKQEQSEYTQIIVRIDTSDNTLYMLKMEAPDYITALNYRSDGSLKHVDTYKSGIRSKRVSYDDYNNVLKDGVNREYYANGKVKKEFYPAGTYYALQDVTLEYNESGNLLKETVGYENFITINENIYDSDGKLYKQIETYEYVNSDRMEYSEKYIHYKDNGVYFIDISTTEDSSDGMSYTRFTVGKKKLAYEEVKLYDFTCTNMTKIERMEGNILKFSGIDYYNNQTNHVFDLNNDKLTLFNKDGLVQEVTQYILKQTEIEKEDYQYSYLITDYDYSRNKRTEAEYDINGESIWYKIYVNDILMYEEERTDENTWVGIEYSFNGEIYSKTVSKELEDGRYEVWIYDGNGNEIGHEWRDWH